MAEIFPEIVEEHVAEPAAENDPERGIENEIVGMAAGERRAGLLEQFQQIPVTDEDPGEVSEAVPAKIERTDVKRDRRQAEIGKRYEAVIVDGLQGLPHQSSAPHKVQR